MRSLTFGYPDLATLASDLNGEEPELPLPINQRGAGGEWVLVVFKVDESTVSSASAARIEDRNGALVLVFEARDWKRLSAELLGGPLTPPKSVRSKRPPSSKRPPASTRAPSSKRAPVSKRAPASKRNPPSSHTSPPRASAPPSQRSATVLTRTLVPPPAPEIHEADAPDQTLEAPLDSGAPPARSHATLRSSKRSPPRLLLVDDDVDLQSMIREMLEAIGLEVQCASDGEQALDRLVLEPFDLVVLDWNLPGISGLDLCREIRRHSRLAGTPVLFLTGKSSSRDLVDAFAAGADDFVAKPFRAPELGARLLALLRRAKIGLSVPPPAE